MAGSYEHGNEPSGFLKSSEFRLAERFSKRTLLHEFSQKRGFFDKFKIYPVYPVEFSYL
jgi:hypothetical protein